VHAAIGSIACRAVRTTSTPATTRVRSRRSSSCTAFPDNLHLYDRLVPHLNPPRRVVTFGFLGWGGSDKPTGYRYTAANQTGELDAVISQLGLDQVTVVVHGRPVRIVFGAADPYLNTRVARRFHQLLPTSELFLLDGARHYVQMDKPEDVARLILAIPEG
jgi:pimeloyl-ACP methyl ester carboxylesterase